MSTAVSYGEATERALALWVVLNRAFASVDARVRADIRKRGYKPTEWAVLEYLYHKGRQPLNRVGDRILITSGSVTYVVDKLEARGLVRRERCDEDRRIIYAVLTEEGREAMKSAFPGHAETVRDLMNALTPEEQETARRLVKKLGLAAEG